MILNIFADTHEGSPKQWHITPLEMIDFDKRATLRDEKTYLVGDIFDFKNTRKKDVTKLKLEYQKVKSHFGSRYIEGNHCGKDKQSYQYYNASFCILSNTFAVDKSISFDHGHHIFWNKEKIRRWEEKEFKGIGFWKYNTMKVVNFLDERFYRNTLKLNKKTKQCFDNYFNDYIVGIRPDIIIFGHKHSDKLFDEVYRDIRWISVPRGLTTMEL